MPFVKTEITGLMIFEPLVFRDERGYFFESYNQNTFLKEALEYRFVQDNQSFSSYGVVRGLHFQLGEHEQAKLVRVLRGRIWDVAVDLRSDSPTFKKWIGVELTAENKKQLLIPRGFGHGFSVLSDEAEIMYKCDNFYCKAAEGGIRYDDPELNIDWGVNKKDIKVSTKDLVLPFLDKMF